MIKCIRNEQGVALVTTLGVVTILLVLATQVSRLAGRGALAATSGDDRYMAEQKAVSGIHLGMLILAKDAADNETDSLQEIWADSEKLEQAVAYLGFETGPVRLQIEDELGKIQLNALVKEYPGSEVNVDQQVVFERFFSLAETEENDREKTDPKALVDAIKDWLDSRDDDQSTGISGAESDYYEGLENPYPCANGPFNQVVELFNVKGIETRLFKTEINHLFTVFGMSDDKNDLGRYTFPGKININTAPVEVLSALMPEGRDHLAKDLADFRIEKASDDDQGFTHRLDKDWHKTIIDLSGEESTALGRKITYASHVFSITCDAGHNQSEVRLSAVIKREKDQLTGQWTCRILRMNRE